MARNSGFSTADVYNYILEWANSHQGNTPTQRQIAQAVGIASGSAHHHKMVLVKQGLLKIVDGALCVVKADFTLHNDAAALTDDDAGPPILKMKSIPANIQGATLSRLKQLGLSIGKEKANGYREAAYPQGWKYEDIEKNGETFLLMDSDERYVALVQDVDGKPTFIYMMES